jgi:hypothetical protein
MEYTCETQMVLSKLILISEAEALWILRFAVRFSAHSIIAVLTEFTPDKSFQGLL